MVYEGGCRCGAVRYRVTGDPLSAGYCHCRMCQSAAGTPVVAWVAFRRADFHFVKGEPVAMAASPRAVRRLCPRCGSALVFEYPARAETVDVTISSLDDPNAADPVYSIWSAPRQAWRHEEGAAVH
ncbi:MAG TPA: GFA family protein [Magnetospirillum sp.]|jgi:hypothetical protein|nr:GFA family protein [Magnetospirillum sp.]